MTRHSLTLLGCTSLLVVACGDDTVPEITPTGSESSSSSSTTDATGSTGPLSSSSEDGGSSSSSSSSTGPDESSSSEESTTEPAIAVECGNSIAQGSEICDGTDLRGQTCQTQGFDGGELVCAANCGYVNITGCYQIRCGNNWIQPGSDEECDGPDLGGQSCTTLGFDSGALACDQTCHYDTRNCVGCGNGEAEEDEVCDGDDFAINNIDCTDLGFTSGVPGCTTACTYDTSTCGLCGNGIIDGTEICDTLALNGTTCESLGFNGGNLACSNTCNYDTIVCDTPTTLFGTDVGYNLYTANPPVLPCDDIFDTGTPTNLGDDAQITVPIGFSFTFYGTNYTQLSINSNGLIGFGGSAGTGLGNVSLPANNPGGGNTSRILAVFWDDLNPGAAGDVIYQTVGNPGFRRFVVQWDVPFFSGGVANDLLHWQVVFHEFDDIIDVCYVDTVSGGAGGNNGGSATVGIQRGNSIPERILFSFNQPFVQSGLHLRYIPL